MKNYLHIFIFIIGASFILLQTSCGSCFGLYGVPGGEGHLGRISAFMGNNPLLNNTVHVTKARRGSRPQEFSRKFQKGTTYKYAIGGTEEDFNSFYPVLELYDKDDSLLATSKEISILNGYSDKCVELYFECQKADIYHLVVSFDQTCSNQKKGQPKSACFYLALHFVGRNADK